MRSLVKQVGDVDRNSAVRKGNEILFADVIRARTRRFPHEDDVRVTLQEGGSIRFPFPQMESDGASGSRSETVSNQVFATFWPQRISLNTTDAPRAEVFGFSQLFQTKIQSPQFDA